MIPLIMLGLAALLFTVGVMSMQIASVGNQNVLVRIGVGLMFISNLLVGVLLVAGAISPMMSL